MVVGKAVRRQNVSAKCSSHQLAPIPSLTTYNFNRMFSVLPRELMVTLHRRGRIWDGPDVESFILECSSDCTARREILTRIPHA